MKTRQKVNLTKSNSIAIQGRGLVAFEELENLTLAELKLLKPSYSKDRNLFNVMCEDLQRYDDFILDHFPLDFEPVSVKEIWLDYDSDLKPTAYRNLIYDRMAGYLSLNEVETMSSEDLALLTPVSERDARFINFLKETVEEINHVG